MSDASQFERESLGWQVRMLQQRVAEWWEFQQTRWGDRLADELPAINSEWIDWLLLWYLIQIASACIVLWLLLRTGRWLWGRLSPSFVREFDRGTNFSTRSRREPNSVRDWVKRSRHLQRRGRYREACICLYFAMLEQLNESGVASDELSRTDGEYLQLLRNSPQNAAYETLLMTHQKVCFDRGEVSPTDFERCQDAYRAIAEGLKTVGER